MPGPYKSHWAVGLAALGVTSAATGMGAGAIATSGGYALGQLIKGEPITPAGLVLSGALGGVGGFLSGRSIERGLEKGAAIAAARRSAAAEAASKTTIATGNMKVYEAASGGVVEYVGITNNLDRRTAEHSASKGIEIQPIQGLEHLSPEDAHAVEQVLMRPTG